MYLESKRKVCFIKVPLLFSQGAQKKSYEQIFIFFVVHLGGQTAGGKHPRKNFKTFFLVFTYIFRKEFHSTIVIIFIFNYSLYVQPTLCCYHAVTDHWARHGSSLTLIVTVSSVWSPDTMLLLEHQSISS